MSDLRCVNGHAVPADFRFCGVCFAPVDRSWSNASAPRTVGTATAVAVPAVRPVVTQRPVIVAPTAAAATPRRQVHQRSRWRWTGTRILKVILVLVAIGLLARFGLSLRDELESQKAKDRVENPAGAPE